MTNSISGFADALYLHVPFCNNICHYCDFAKSIFRQEKADEWLNNIEKQIKIQVLNDDLKTIYIGGGTPTSLKLHQLDKLLNYLRPLSNNVIEYTIESNIENINLELITLLKKYHVNRISLGVQSLDDNLLKLMNRKHTKEDVFKAIKLLDDNGINNISVDMIYGFKELSLDNFKNNLQLLVNNQAIKHISLYSLTIEENTYFHKVNYETINDIQEANFYNAAIKELTHAGFHQYEVANFARDNYESLHNKYYWEYKNFYGIGYGASGKLDNIRFTNTKNGIEKLILSRDDMIFEHIMMNLRLVKGLDIEDFNKKYNIDLLMEYKLIINDYLIRDMLILDNGYLKTTNYGLINLNDILVSFLR